MIDQKIVEEIMRGTTQISSIPESEHEPDVKVKQLEGLIPRMGAKSWLR